MNEAMKEAAMRSGLGLIRDPAARPMGAKVSEDRPLLDVINNRLVLILNELCEAASMSSDALDRAVLSRDMAVNQTSSSGHPGHPIADALTKGDAIMLVINDLETALARHRTIAARLHQIA